MSEFYIAIIAIVLMFFMIVGALRIGYEFGKVFGKKSEVEKEDE